MQQEFLFAGFGGQGVMFAGQLLAYAAMDEGLEVTWIPSYGPEMRGGTAHCFVVISDRAIGSPIVRHPSTVIVFNNPSFTKYESVVAAGGMLVLNASLIAEKPSRTDILYLPVTASEIADQLGNAKLTNVVLLGAALESSGIIPIETVRAALKRHLPARHQHLLDLNYAALEQGRKLAAKHEAR